MKRTFILSIITTLLSVLVFFIAVHAWFAESDTGKSHLEEQLIQEETDQYTIGTIINGEMVEEVEVDLFPGQKTVFGYEINYQTTGDFSIQFSNISINKEYSTEESNSLFNQIRYSGAKILNKTTDQYINNKIDLSLYEAFVENADCREAIYYAVVVSKVPLQNWQINDEAENTTIENEDIIAKKSYQDVIGNRSDIMNIIPSLHLTIEKYYIYVSLYFDPFIYPTITQDDNILEINNSNPYMYQDLSITIKYYNVKTGGVGNE